MEKCIFYSSNGIKLAGLLFFPSDHRPGDKRPGIVLANGFNGVKELIMPDHAKAFTDAGFVCLSFDYRGYGESEGTRWRLIPTEQAEDVNNAYTYLAQRPEVDKDRVGIFGASFGGAVTVWEAAFDPRPKCIVIVGGIGNGERWLASLRRYWEWREFLKKVEEDRVKRVLTGKSEDVHPHDILAPDPLSAKFRDEKVTPLGCKLPLESGDAIINFKPEELVHRIAPRPILFAHPEADVLVPIEESLSLYAKACEPKKLVTMKGATHFDQHIPGPAFTEVNDASIEWFRHYL